MSITDISPMMFPSLRGAVTSSVTLDAAEEFCVVVLKISRTGTLNKIGWRTGAITAGTSYTLKISVETVAETVGRPVATTNAAKTLYAAGAESADISNGLSSNTSYWTPINGETGISVTKGDCISVTFRLTAIEGASITVHTMQAAKGGDMVAAYVAGVYTATYLGSSWSVYAGGGFLSLQYSDGVFPQYMIYPLYIVGVYTYNSGTATGKYRGIKFKYPVKTRITGLNININTGADWQLILYDSDEYTVATGFPITVKALQRGTTGYRDIFVQFPVDFEATSDTWYRLIILPTTTTDIYMPYYTPVDDGAVLGINGFFGGSSFVYSQRNSAPSSGDHTWTDSTVVLDACLMIDGIETSAGGTGGISRSRQLMG